MTESDLLVQRLVNGERLLFSSEKAELTLGPPGTTGNQGPIKGALAITDRRIYVVEKPGFFSGRREFEAIFSSNYARQLIKETTSKNDELKPLAKKVSMISRSKWLKQHGYRISVDILTDVNLDRGILARNNLFLQIYHAFTDSDMRKAIENGRKANESLAETAPGVSNLLGELASSVGFTLVSSTCQLRIKQPLSMSADVAAMDFAVEGDEWLVPIVDHYKEKTDITYGPLLEIMQAKAPEISAYIKEYENLSN